MLILSDSGWTVSSGHPHNYLQKPQFCQLGILTSLVPKFLLLVGFWCKVSWVEGGQQATINLALLTTHFKKLLCHIYQNVFHFIYVKEFNVLNISRFVLLCYRSGVLVQNAFMPNFTTIYHVLSFQKCYRV